MDAFKPKGVFKYYISNFSLILDPHPPPLFYFHKEYILGHWGFPLQSISSVSVLAQTPHPPKRADVILERSLTNKFPLLYVWCVVLFLCHPYYGVNRGLHHGGHFETDQDLEFN